MSKTTSIKKRRWTSDVSSALLAAKFLSPALIVMGVVIIFPILSGVRLSFFEYKLTQPGNFAFNFPGNYTKMLDDPVFWETMGNTLVFVSITVVVGLVLGLVMALAIYGLPQRLQGLRGVLLVPWVVPGVVIGYLFMYMFDSEMGIINYLLTRLNIIDKFLPWLMRGDLAMGSVIVTHIWNQTPFYMLMLTAGLMSIPTEAREASYLEGASYFQDFRFVIFPYLAEIVVISSLLMVIRNLNFFPIIFTMTGGGPVYSTTTGVLYIYRLAFERFDVGYATAVGTLWVIVLMVFSALYIRVLRDRF